MWCRGLRRSHFHQQARRQSTFLCQRPARMLWLSGQRSCDGTHDCNGFHGV